MDFVLLINEQQKQLQLPNSYFSATWKSLIHPRDPADEICATAKQKFEYHLPVAVQAFFNKCIHKVQSLLDQSSTLEWENLDKKYLMVVLYWGVTQIDNLNTFVPLSAARLYLLLNSITNEEYGPIYHESIYKAILDLIVFYLPADHAYTQLHLLLDNLKMFLAKNKVSEELIPETTTVLYKIISVDSLEALNSFNLDENTINSQHAALICCKILLQRLDQNNDRDKKTILHILFTLTANLSSSQVRSKNRQALETLQRNVRAFLKDCNAKFVRNNTSLVSSVIKTLAVQPNFDLYDEMVLIIRETDYNIYCAFCWWVIEGLVCDQDEYRKCLPNIAAAIIRYPPSHQTAQKREAMTEVLLTNLMKLCSDSNYDIKENAFRCLDMIVNSEDSTIRTVVRRVVHQNHCVMINVFKKQLDVKWKKKLINRCFISIVCKVSFNTESATDEALKTLGSLFVEACPMDIRPCVNKIADLLRHNSTQTQLVHVILGLLVKMTLRPEAISNYYTKVLYDLLFQSIEANLDSTNCLNIADILISKSFNHDAVFQKFHSMNLLFPAKLKILIDNKISQDPKALKLVCAMLCYLDHDKFGSFVQFTEAFFQDKSFQHGSLFFYAINKILSKKLPEKCTPADITYIKQLQFYLESNIEIRMIPVHCVTNAVALLVNLQKFSGGTLKLEMILQGLSKSLHTKLLKIYEGDVLEAFEICRDLIYVGDFVLLTDLKVPEEVVTVLRNLIKSNNEQHTAYLQNHPKIWSFLISFHTKLSLKDKSLIEENIAILENALSSDHEQVRYHALRSMEDICALQLSYFEPLIPWIFQILKEDRDSFLTLICAKILHKLVCEDYIILNESQYVLISALLGHKNEWFRERIGELLQENFLLKCQHTIAAFFVPSVVYYNNYKTHDVYFFHENENLCRPLTRIQRKHIYKFLFVALPKNVQFNVMNDITTQILGKILKGKLINSSDLLIDCVTITNILASHVNEAPASPKRMYKKAVKEIQTNIVEKRFEPSHSHFSSNGQQLTVLRKLIIALIKIAFQIKVVNESLRRELLHTILALTDSFLSEITVICKEGAEDLRKLYQEFLRYYGKYKHVLNYEEAEDEHEVYVVQGPSGSLISQSSYQIEDEFVERSVS